MLTARSFKEPNDKELSSALLGPGKNRENPQRLVWGDFCKIVENLNFNFSTRSRRKSKFLTHGVLNGNCHTPVFLVHSDREK